MMKTLLVQRKEKPGWVSMDLLRRGLLGSYLQILPDAKLFFWPSTRERLPKCERLVFTDSLPHPLLFLKQYQHQLSGVQEFNFHLYGNFLLSLPEWSKSLEILRSKRVRFFVGSSAYAKVVQTALPAIGDHLEIVPFAVENEKSRPRRLRKKRKKLMYWGRLSSGKNVDLLVRYFHQFLTENPHLKEVWSLQLVGAYDDRESYFYFHREGYFYQHLSKLIQKSLRSGIQIEVQEFQPRAQLKRLWSQADAYVSLSSHHDEDFGLASIEAAQQGLPSLLTCWGGHLDVLDWGLEQVWPISVRLGRQGYQISYLEFERALLELSEGGAHRIPSVHAKNAETISKICSPRALAQNLRLLYAAEARRIASADKQNRLALRRIQQWRAGHRSTLFSVSSQDRLYASLYDGFYSSRSRKKRLATRLPK